MILAQCSCHVSIAVYNIGMITNIMNYPNDTILSLLKSMASIWIFTSYIISRIIYHQQDEQDR